MNEEQGPKHDVLESVCAADVKMRAIRWLWPNRFALGKLGIIGGMPDQGKGCITAYDGRIMAVQ